MTSDGLETGSADEPTPVDDSPDERDVLVEVVDLKKHFPIMSGLVKRQVGAVRAVDVGVLDAPAMILSFRSSAIGTKRISIVT